MLAGSPALPSWINGCGPVALWFEAARPLTTLRAMPYMSDNADVSVLLGCAVKAEDVRTEKSGASSSSSVWARVPSSQLWHNLNNGLRAGRARAPVHGTLCQTLLDSGDLIVCEALRERRGKQQCQSRQIAHPDDQSSFQIQERS